MKAIAKVVDVNDNVATVLSTRNSACESCHNCAGKDACHAHLVFGNQTESVTLKVKNTLNANVGDTVELESSTGKTLLIAACLFIVPVLLAVCVYMYLKCIFVSETVSAIGMLLTFVASFGICAVVMNKFVKKHLSVYIVKIVEESGN